MSGARGGSPLARLTTCRAELPKEWIMSKEQVAKLDQIDVDSRKEHAESMQRWDRLKSSSEYPTI